MSYINSLYRNTHQRFIFARYIPYNIDSIFKRQLSSSNFIIKLQTVNNIQDERWKVNRRTNKRDKLGGRFAEPIANWVVAIRDISIDTSLTSWPISFCGWYVTPTEVCYWNSSRFLLLERIWVTSRQVPFSYRIHHNT